MQALSTHIRKNNYLFFLPAILCIMNLLFMHYVIITTCQTEFELDITSYIDNFCSTVIDVCILFIILYLVTWKRWKAAWTITFIISILWSFSNVIYSRFFMHYISLSAINQGGALFDWLIIRCIIDKLQWIDLYFIFSLFLFIYICSSLPQTRHIHVFRKTSAIIILMFATDIFLFAAYCVSVPEYRSVSYFTYKYKQRHINSHLALCEPVAATFHRGIIQNLVYEIGDKSQGNLTLDEHQRKQILSGINETKESRNIIQSPTYQENIIFILVESYMSFVSDMTIDGHEVTPFLNTLKHDSATYYNGHMKANITIGESSDGQFTYLTGLLPLRSVITISKAKDCVLPGLPKLFNKQSRMIIPTIATMWMQDKMCQQYGFDSLYSSSDYAHGSEANLNDEQVFQLAIEKDLESKKPFFSVILTLSMHQPYTKQIDSTFVIDNTSVPDHELACYLNVCHYTDRQIERYFQHLKETGLYDKSLIVIASDHHVHSVGDRQSNLDIPFYIVNGNFKNAWEGTCQQVDVYTTLLDIMGINSNWCGLGQSLLSPDYTEKELKWDVSEWILKSDYFNKD